MSDEDYLRGRTDERNRILAFLTTGAGHSITCAAYAVGGDRWCTLNYGHLGSHISANSILGSVSWVSEGPVEVVESGSGVIVGEEQ